MVPFIPDASLRYWCKTVLVVRIRTSALVKMFQQNHTDLEAAAECWIMNRVPSCVTAYSSPDPAGGSEFAM